jgi:hypothetical protein
MGWTQKNWAGYYYGINRIRNVSIDADGAIQSTDGPIRCNKANRSCKSRYYGESAGEKFLTSDQEAEENKER